MAPEGVLLPKGSTGDPLDRRPVWLLPSVYRLWAARRSRPFARWVSSWPGAPLLVGAADQAWALAVDVERAKVDERTLLSLSLSLFFWGGAAFNWCKANDYIGLQALERACVAPALVGPALQVYRAPRRIKVLQVRGSA